MKTENDTSIIFDNDGKVTLNFNHSEGNKMQKVVRTYPETFTRTTGALFELLKQGYSIVMCHEIYAGNGKKCLEYIVEKNEEKE